MPSTVTPLVHLRATPVHDGLRFSADDLEHLPHLGTCAKLAFRHVWCRVHDAALATHSLSQNEFLVMLATEASNQPADTSQTVTMMLNQLVVLRVEDWETAHNNEIQHESKPF